MPKLFYLLNEVMANATTSNLRNKLTCMTQLLKNSYILQKSFFFKFRNKLKSYDFPPDTIRLK